MTRRILSLRSAFALLAVVTCVAVLVERGTARTRFPHPAHKDVECAVCHAQAPASRAGGDLLLPGAEACLDCHTQEDIDGYGWAPPPAVPSGFPAFSHEQHLAMEGVDCTTCHGALVEPSLQGTGKGEIGHPLCFTCHDGKGASADCAACHAEPDRLRPADHGVDYLHTHQFEARGNAGACESCHRQSEDCSECHQGDNVLFRTHDRNYAFTHAQDARKHELDCASCHDIDRFCSDCHIAEGVRPTNHDRTDWVSFTGGINRHAVEARRDIMVCAGCHEQDDPNCVRCHRDRPGRGNDANIHPGDFDDYDIEGPWHDDPSYLCYDCHQRNTAPDGFCAYCHDPGRGD